MHRCPTVLIPRLHPTGPSQQRTAGSCNYKGKAKGGASIWDWVDGYRALGSTADSYQSKPETKYYRTMKLTGCACKPPAQPEGISKCRTPVSLVLERKLLKANVRQKVSLQNGGPGSHCSALLCMSPELARPSTTSMACYLITSDCI